MYREDAVKSGLIEKMSKSSKGCYLTYLCYLTETKT